MKGGEDPSQTATGETVSAYEATRLERIAANRQLLVDLGLASALEGLQVLKVPKPEKKPSAGSERKRKAPDEVQPSRRSKRISGEGQKEHADGEGKTEHSEELEEMDRAPPSRSRSQAGRSWEERMAEIKMGALVELTKQQAIFIVVGSTDKHYKVQLGNSGNKCACRDFRIRGKQRPCKHLRLLLQDLGVESHPKGWFGAVSDHLDQQASAAGASGSAQADET